MKRIAPVIVFLWIPFLTTFSQGRKAITLDDIYGPEKFIPKSFEKLKWIPGTSAFTYLFTDETDEVESIMRYDVETDEETTLLDDHTLRSLANDTTLSIGGYSWCENGSTLLVETDIEEVWRHSTKCKTYVFDVNESQVLAVDTVKEELSNVRLSPDGASVGYVYENNLYTLNIKSGMTAQWTHDGSESIINGQFDWVYEEEFSISQGWQWSPDGQRIAFWRLDQSMVPEFSWIDYNPLHQELTTIRYPKAGEPIADVKIGIVDLGDSGVTWIDLGDETGFYIPRIKWTNDPHQLSIERLNRKQNRLELLLADVRSGKTRTVLVEADPCWVDVHDNLLFLRESDRFLWTSQRDGYNHIYLYRMDDGSSIQLTEGDWEVCTIHGTNPKSGMIFYSSGEVDGLSRTVHAVSQDGARRAGVADQPGWHKPLFSPDCQYFVDRWSTAKTPTEWRVKATTGAVNSIILESEMAFLDDYQLAYPVFLKVQTTDGAWLDASIIKPPDFDPNRKYPVVVSCYGGPGGRMVRNAWGGKGFLWENVLARHGYIVFSIDNRGIGGRGKQLANLAWHNLGHWAVQDHIEGAKYLASLPYVDPNRIGITGWSFGGYLTLLAMTMGADHFATGVAGAPLTAWELYDNIYTERYMGTPEENQEGYDSASVLTYADKLKGDLLIIHGTCDDNVHVQNTMQLAEKFQKADKRFSMMVYPNHDHSVSGDEEDKTSLHLHKLITDFILDNL